MGHNSFDKERRVPGFLNWIFRRYPTYVHRNAPVPAPWEGEKGLAPCHFQWEVSAFEKSCADRPPEKPEIPGYNVLFILNKGGMGEVWKAEQCDSQDNVLRPVALKILPQGLTQQEAIHKELALRFEKEISVIAKIEHPNVARFYEARSLGSHYYFAMQYVDGMHLDKHVKEHGLSLREMFLLLADIADTIHVVHNEYNLLHRDLKPSNILVRADNGRPVIIDFGLAKASLLFEGVQKIDHVTHIAGTLPYMSPEQLEGPMHLAPASDVYSLGIVMYELLTGSLPYQNTKTEAELREDICQGRLVPLRPGISACVQGQQKSRRVRFFTREREQVREIEAIILKALAHKAEARYLTAQEFAQDLRNYAAENIVNAMPRKPWYAFRKLMRPYRRVVFAAGTLLLLLLLILGWSNVKIRVAAREAQTQLAENYMYRAFVENRFHNDPLHALLLSCKSIESALRAQKPIGRYAILLQQLAAKAPLWIVPGNESLYTVEFSADGQRLACATRGGQAFWRDTRNGSVLGQVGSGKSAEFIMVDASGRRHAVVYGNGTLEIRDLDGTIWAVSLVHPANPEIPVTAAALEPNSTRVAIGYGDGKVAIRNRLDENIIWVNAAKTVKVSAITFLPGKQELLCGYDDGSVFYCNASNGQGVYWLGSTGEAISVTDIKVGLDGSLIAVVFNQNGAGHLLLLDTAGFDPFIVRKHTRYPFLISSLDFVPGHTKMLFGALDGAVCLWDWQEDTMTFLASGHRGPIIGVKSVLPGSTDANAVNASPALLAVSEDGSVSMWELVKSSTMTLEVDKDQGNDYWLCPTGEHVLACKDMALYVYSVFPNGTQTVQLDRSEDQIILQAGLAYPPVFSLDGQRFATFHKHGRIQVWDTVTARPLADMQPESATSLIALNGNGTRLLAAGAGHIQLWDIETRSVLHTIEFTGDCTSISLDASGDLAAMVNHEKKIIVCNMYRGTRMLVGEPDIAYNKLRFSPGGRYLAASSFAGTVDIFDVIRHRFIGESIQLKSEVLDFCFSAEDHWLFTSTADNIVRAWEADTGLWVGEDVVSNISATQVGFSSRNNMFVAFCSESPRLRCRPWASAIETVPPWLPEIGEVLTATRLKDSQTFIPLSPDEYHRVMENFIAQTYKARESAHEALLPWIRSNHDFFSGSMRGSL